ncbi:MAG TPA: hypothetical protein VGO34_14875 [Alphaproteobacteria bacterium]|jgi:hypothetical protein
MAGEEGITNLGDIPRGMTFEQAIKATRHLRQYSIDRHDGGNRLTICDTLRQIWLTLDGMPNSTEKDLIVEYVQAAADMAKRMDARIKELKAQLHG